MEVIPITKNLLGFYEGRNGAPRPGAAKDWVQFDLDLGVCAYAVHYRGDAIVFDTLVSPDHGRLMRAYLEEDLGIRDILVVLSHWHLDHVGGAAAFQGYPLVSSAETRIFLENNRAAIESGELWGPPPLKPLAIPDANCLARVPLSLGDLEIELIPWNIHTPGSLALYSGKDKILLAGDMLEDNIPCLNHPEAAHTYLADLKAMAAMDIEAIYPAHGCPDKIGRGGYGKDFIAATAEYIRYVLKLCQEGSGATETSLKDWIAPWEAVDTLRYHPVYEGVHQANLQRLREYYQNRPVPEIAD